MKRKSLLMFGLLATLCLSACGEESYAKINWHNGTTMPSSSISAIDGDYYFDIDDGIIYSYKNGSWSVAITIGGGNENESKNAYQVYKSKKEAEKASENMPGQWNGTGDAYRHCVWNCEMAKKIGQDEAKKFADAHEDEKNGNCYETTMDLHNNAIGRELAKNAETDCANACRQALNEGKLRKFDVDYNKNPQITGPMSLTPTKAF